MLVSKLSLEPSPSTANGYIYGQRRLAKYYWRNEFLRMEVFSQNLLKLYSPQSGRCRPPSIEGVTLIPNFLLSQTAEDASRTKVMVCEDRRNKREIDRASVVQQTPAPTDDKLIVLWFSRKFVNTTAK
jgi:hypothetical protein